MSRIYIIFFGPPGSGKGTQAEILSEKFKLPIISVGALLRREIESKTDLGKKIKPIVEQGHLIDDDIANEIIARRVRAGEIDRGAIFDGYPRKISQQDFFISLLDELIEENDNMYAILVDVSDEVALKHLGGRRSCSCGATYHIVNNPPKQEGVCDDCGQKLFIRNDDKEEVIAKRLQIYHEIVKPMLDYWEKNGKLFRVNGEQSIEEVQSDIINLLNKRGISLRA